MNKYIKSLNEVSLALFVISLISIILSQWVLISKVEPMFTGDKRLERVEWIKNTNDIKKLKEVAILQTEIGIDFDNYIKLSVEALRGASIVVFIISSILCFNSFKLKNKISNK